MLSIITGRNLNRTLAVWSLLLAAGGVGLAGCDKLPLLAPGLSTITLSSSNTIVQSNGVAQVSATILEQSGTPVQNGTTVTFTTTLGTLLPAEARTVNGVATTQFAGSGQSGIAEIRAISGGAKPSDPANTSLKLTVGGAAAGRVGVTANPTTVPLAGGTSTIVANVADSSGNALVGVAVTFSTTAGSLSSAVATTDSSGNAQTTLTTNRNATVTATAGAGTGTTAPSGTVTVTVNATGAVAIAVSPSTGLLVNQVASISITLTAPASGGAFQRVVVDFGDGGSTTTAGTSSTVTHAYTRSGTFVVRATAFDSFGDSATTTAAVTVASPPRPTVSISASPTNPTAGSVTTFTIGVTPPAGGSIDNVTLTFGDGSSVNLGAASGTGQTVQHVYQAAATYTATVEAEDTAGGSASASTVISVAAQPPLGVTIATSQTASGGFTSVNFTASVTPTGTPVADYHWTFGDTPNTSRHTTGNQTTFSYVTASGPKTVTLTVTATNGQTGNTSTTVTP